MVGQLPMGPHGVVVLETDQILMCTLVSDFDERDALERLSHSSIRMDILALRLV